MGMGRIKKIQKVERITKSKKNHGTWYSHGMSLLSTLFGL